MSATNKNQIKKIKSTLTAYQKRIVFRLIFYPSKKWNPRPKKKGKINTVISCKANEFNQTTQCYANCPKKMYFESTNSQWYGKKSDTRNLSHN